MPQGIKPLPTELLDLESVHPHEFEPHQFYVTVGWGDCDPAQIAYTARIPEWTLTAIEDWYVYCLTSNWFDINIHRGIGTPFVSLNCDFHFPVTTRYPLEMRVFVSRLGHSSLTHQVEGYQNGKHCFSVKTTAAFVDASRMKPIPIPPNMRANIENYLRNQGRSVGS
ncbi:MAG: acyl-CoA thioesterase [Gammaproteobacteria bacterium]|nr:acyl-CoA thioesterase [Gammaproteobacteria bacterium]